MRIELLKILTAQAQQYELGDRVWESLKPADIAHVLGLIKVQPAAWLGKIMIAGDEAVMPDLVDHVAKSVLRRLGGDTRNPERFFSVCQAAVKRFVDPKWCPACHGAEVQSLQKRARDVICRACNGARIAPPPSGRDLAAALNIPQPQWAKRWGEVYDEADWRLHLLLDILIGGFARALGYQNEGSEPEPIIRVVSKTLKNKAIAIKV